MSDFIKHSFSTLIVLVLLCSCSNTQSQIIEPAAERSDLYLNLLQGKSVALITNHSAQVGEEHLVDFLLANEIDIIRIFAPEHGFRGDKSDGAKIKNEVDSKTGLALNSLYGKNKKPSAELLKDVDLVLFDIQDVGLRFYTYISSMSLAMEAAAENNISFIVLDRPNPNGNYIDGPVLNPAYSSFVGMHPVPVVYGMTIGEYAKMVKGEGWIKKSENLDLTIIPIANYTHDSLYSLPIAPSPNLPNDRSVQLYSSLCYLEAANVSIGRGTNKPFQLMGYPNYKNGDYSFTPKSIPGMSKYPKFENQECLGFDLSGSIRSEPPSFIEWEYVWTMYEALGEDAFFKSVDFFNKLSGSDQLHQALKKGLSIDEFRDSYQDDLNAFKKVRKKYLLYP